MADHRTDRPTTPTTPSTAEQWRQILREQPPEEIRELPRRKRRRARRAWRSARRAERAEIIRRERRQVPTPLYVPVIALLVAAAVGTAALLQTDDDKLAKEHAAPDRTVAPAEPGRLSPPPSTAAPDVPRPTDPEELAKAFMSAYAKRSPAFEETHVQAVQRAAPYASTALVDNLTKHRDKDWDHLIAAQANYATPTRITVSVPRGKDAPGVDTSLRIYRKASARIQVKGTDNYTYTRHLVLEVARHDVGDLWQVTRVFGLGE
ncbi:hypothetical protein [Streptomyces venezuelae]|uniref:hypothetical protein n=1 Tax=Streptomyces venezuelae TaxID=54571 RepID=UPI00342D0ACA